MTESAWLLALMVPLFALVAAVYASVGLGGGTGYLALMVLCGVSSVVMPSTALALNLTVTSAALLRYGLAGRLRWAIFLPFLLTALPCAFLGGLIEAPQRIFFTLLAVALGVAALALWRSARRPEGKPLQTSLTLRLLVGLPAGCAFGLASGMLGIGGGVFLGPTVLLLRWAGPKEAAAMTSAFVLALSASGLLAHGSRGAIDLRLVAPLAGAALVGGLLGSHLGETRLSPGMLRRILTVILAIAAIKAGISALAG